MSLRIGSTRPMPMKAITHAKATAHTARGWEKNEPDRTGAVVGLVGVAGQGLPSCWGLGFYIGNLWKAPDIPVTPITPAGGVG